MRTAIDDLPASESISRLRASGVIAAKTRHDHPVRRRQLQRRRPPSQIPQWRQLVASTSVPAVVGVGFLRLFEGGLACRWCLGARGLRPRVQLIATPQRAAHVAPKLIARLTSASPARLHPRPGRVFDRRSRFEAKVRRSVIVARQHALDEHDELLARLERVR